MILWLIKLQEFDQEEQENKAKKLKKSWKDINGILTYQGILFVLKILKIKLICRDYLISLTCHFGFDKIQKLIAQKYYCFSRQKNVKTYNIVYNICLISKTVKHKLYNDLQLLPVPIYCWKVLSMDFLTGQLISANWKDKDYNSIFVIIDRLIKLVSYK